MGFGENTQCLPKSPDCIFLYFTPYSVVPFGGGEPGLGMFLLMKKEEISTRVHLSS